MMRNDTKQLIVKAASDYLQKHDLKNVDLARMSGVRAEYLSAMMRSNFEIKAGGKKVVAIADQYFHQLANSVGYTIGKVYWETKPTEQLTAALAILEESKAFGDTSIIIGETGAGKTYAADLFARKNPTDVFHIVIGSSDNLSDLIDKVCDALGIKAEGSTKSKRIRTIIGYLTTLRSRGKRPQLIFDESEYAKMAAICAIKELYDGLNTICSIVMIGTDQFIKNLDKWCKRNKNGIPQFFRRIKFSIRYLPIINKSFSQFLESGIDKKLALFLKKNCGNYGELHDVLVPTMREADRLGQPVTLDLVKQVLNIEIDF